MGLIWKSLLNPLRPSYHIIFLMTLLCIALVEFSCMLSRCQGSNFQTALIFSFQVIIYKVGIFINDVKKITVFQILFLKWVRKS